MCTYSKTPYYILLTHLAAIWFNPLKGRPDAPCELMGNRPMHPVNP